MGVVHYFEPIYTNLECDYLSSDGENNPVVIGNDFMEPFESRKIINGVCLKIPVVIAESNLWRLKN